MTKITEAKVVLDMAEELYKTQHLLQQETERVYKWAEIINRLACLALDGADSNGRDFAQDTIEMVGPFLGLAGE